MADDRYIPSFYGYEEGICWLVAQYGLNRDEAEVVYFQLRPRRNK